jgi:hypothetical protein
LDNPATIGFAAGASDLGQNAVGSACSRNHLVSVTATNPSGGHMKFKILKYLILIFGGAIVGGGMGWMSRCAGGGA